MTELPDFLPSPPSPEDIPGRTRSIYQTVLRRSPLITLPNFVACAPSDLALMFDLYDATFFGGAVRARLQAGGTPLAFHFSPRLTRSAGLTKRFAARANGHERTTRFEIILSSALLFQTFTDVQRPVQVNGVECRDRLEAAQRVFEHELLHLIEMLAWAASNCDAARYKGLARDWFAHPETRHDLVTQQERARDRFDLRVGDRVAFSFEGAAHVGIVNRITRRATVLVESPRGEPYADGKRYLKFYIPLTMLEKADGPERSR